MSEKLPLLPGALLVSFVHSVSLEVKEFRIGRLCGVCWASEICVVVRIGISEGVSIWKVFVLQIIMLYLLEALRYPGDYVELVLFYYYYYYYYYYYFCSCVSGVLTYPASLLSIVFFRIFLFPFANLPGSHHGPVCY